MQETIGLALPGNLFTCIWVNESLWHSNIPCEGLAFLYLSLRQSYTFVIEVKLVDMQSFWAVGRFFPCFPCRLQVEPVEYSGIGIENRLISMV